MRFRGRTAGQRTDQRTNGSCVLISYPFSDIGLDYEASALRRRNMGSATAAVKYRERACRRWSRKSEPEAGQYYRGLDRTAKGRKDN